MITTDRRVRETFVELADTLVDDYDVIAFLDTLARRAVELMGVTACGILLVDHHQVLNLVAASSERTRLLELFQLQNSEGPCLDCYHSGASVQCADLAEADQRWPRFAPAARDTGFAAVRALPMRLRTTVIGAMNLFDATAVTMDSDAVALGQALADVATIGILQQRALQHQEVVTQQLHAALSSRILIEQAKGILAERMSLSVDDAFVALRDHARSSNRKLHDVAEAVLTGDLDIPASPTGGRSV